MSSTRHLLIGHTIQAVFMTEQSLVFQIEPINGFNYIEYNVEGDCCSQSVFYDFYNAPDLIGKKVIDVQEIELEYQESIQVYGYRVVTDDPTVFATFSFRNYSNGYYGGDLKAIPESKNKIKEIEPIYIGYLETTYTYGVYVETNSIATPIREAIFQV